ncbi:hypothetical protein AAF712_005110 [Marasmius tenuissimus]|uniref:HECT domain-containing protein n=1 Tax=Marasmius tenuissimus TaxID=585030 RepID=A0ABR3A1R9_9AGAR
MNFNNFGPEALGQIVAAFLRSQVAAPLVTNTVNSDHSLSTNTPAPSQFSGTSGPSQPNNSPAVTSPSPFSAALLAQLTQAQPAASTNAMAGPSQIPSGVSSTPTAVQGSQPIAPYTSVNMLNAVANSTPLQSRDGRPRVTTQAGFPSIDLIRNANNARLDHAAAFGLPRYLVKYTRHQDSFNAVLNRLHLYHEFHDIDVKTTVMEVLATVVEVLREYGYNLDPPHMAGPSAFQPHEQVPLQLLAFTNRGRANGLNKTWKLATGSFSATSTLEDLITDKDYAHPKLSVTPRGFFELNTNVTTRFYTQESCRAWPAGDDAIKTHCCIPKRVYTLRDDAEAGSGEVMVTEQRPRRTIMATREMMRMMRKGSRSPTLLNRPALLSVRPLIPRQFPQLVEVPRRPEMFRQPHHHQTAAEVLRPPAVFLQLWILGKRFINVAVLPVNNAPPVKARSYRSVELTVAREKEPSLATREFHLLSAGQRNRLCGTERLRLKGVIVECLLRLTEILAVHSVNAAGELSSGIGVEREAVQTLAHGYLSRRASTFFLPQGPQFSMLAAVNGPSARWMSNDQKMDWGILGTLVALSLIYGLGTEPLNPLALIFYLNDCHVACLHSDLVSRWFPELHGTLKAWASLGHEDDIARSYQGGSEEFVSSVYDSYIHHYSSLRLDYQSLLKDESTTKLNRAIQDNPSFSAASFQDLFRGFLEGSGYPSLELMNGVKGRLSPVISLDEIHQDTFRMRMFCWAATGAPFVLTDGIRTKVILIEDDDEEYRAGLTDAQCLTNLNAGVCKFRSCLREMRIPASFLLHLLSIDYVTAASTFSGDEGAASSATPSSSQSSNEGLALTVKEAVEHWLLASVLDNVGESNLV